MPAQLCTSLNPTGQPVSICRGCPVRSSREAPVWRLHRGKHLVHDLSQELQLLWAELRQQQQLPEKLNSPILMNGVRGGLAYEVGRPGFHLPRWDAHSASGSSRQGMHLLLEGHAVYFADVTSL